MCFLILESLFVLDFDQITLAQKNTFVLNALTRQKCPWIPPSFGLLKVLVIV